MTATLENRRIEPGDIVETSGRHVGDTTGAAHIVDAQDATSTTDPEGGCSQRRFAALVDLQIEQSTQEGLVGCRQQEWIAERGQQM